MPHQATNNVRILPGTYLYTWVESNNADKESCWRTKVPGMDRNRTRNPLIQSQGFNPIYHGTSICLYNWNCSCFTESRLAESLGTISTAGEPLLRWPLIEPSSSSVDQWSALNSGIGLSHDPFILWELQVRTPRGGGGGGALKLFFDGGVPHKTLKWGS